MKQILLCLFILLLIAGCDNRLIAEGKVTRIEITSGGFASPAQRVFYLNNGSVVTVGQSRYQDVKIGDYIYFYIGWGDPTIRSSKR